MSVRKPGTPRNYRRENNKRNSAGVTATLLNEATGNRDVIVSPGFVNDALADICDECERRGPDWKVQCLSTPRTIMADVATRTIAPSGRAMIPEFSLLSKVGRSDLLATELRGSHDYDY